MTASHFPSDSSAASSDLLLPAVYVELRHLAARQLANERPGQTLQTVVHGEPIENMAGLDELQLRISAAYERSFRGEIDELLVFKRDLSLSEIQQLHRHSKGGKSLVD